MARLLLLETATGVCSVGVGEHGRLIGVRTAPDTYRHGAQLTLLIESVLAEPGWEMEQLDAVVVSAGPGSYTSLRVGAATAKGICYALSKPLIAVDTLESLARAAERATDGANDLYIPMIDARRMEVYLALFARGGKRLVPDRAEIINGTNFDGWKAPDRSLILCGDGAAKCESVLNGPPFRYRTEIVCSAANLLPMATEKWKFGQFENLISFEPNYLKPPNVTKPKSRL